MSCPLVEVPMSNPQLFSEKKQYTAVALGNSLVGFYIYIYECDTVCG